MEKTNKISGFIKAIKVSSKILSVFSWIGLVSACLAVVLWVMFLLFGEIFGEITDDAPEFVIAGIPAIIISALSTILAERFYNKKMGKKNAKVLFVSMIILAVSYILHIVPLLFESIGSTYVISRMFLYLITAVASLLIGLLIKDLSYDNQPKLKVLVIVLLVTRGLMALVNEIFASPSLMLTPFSAFDFLFNFAVGGFYFLPIAFYVFLYPQIEGEENLS